MVFEVYYYAVGVGLVFYEEGEFYKKILQSYKLN